MLPLLLLLTTALVPLPLTSALSFEFGRPPTSPGFRGVTTGGGVDLNSITLYHAYFGEVIVNPDSGAEVDTEEFSTFVQRLFAGLDMNRDGRVSQAEMDEGLRVGRTDGSIPEEWDVKISSLIAPLVADGVGGGTSSCVN